jgi:hypothetical protein
MLAEADEPDTGDLYDSGGAQLSDQWAERQLLGHLLNRPQLLPVAVEIVRDNDFFDPFHRRIYAVLQRALETGDDIRSATVIEALGGDPKAILFDDVTVGAYFASLVANADLTASVEEVAECVAACSERRAVGTADDVDFGLPIVSRFGGMRWEDIGAPGSPQYEWIVENLIPRDARFRSARSRPHSLYTAMSRRVANRIPRRPLPRWSADNAVA